MKAKLVCLAIGVIISLRGLAVSGGGFVFLADSVAGDQGTQVFVPIRALDFDSIISIQGTVGFDSAGLTFLSVQSMGLPSMSNANFGTTYALNGRITFSWNENNLTPITVADSTVLFALLFQVTGQPGDQVPIPILGSPTLLEVVDWSYNTIPFAVRGGNVSINIPQVCEIPDSLAARNIMQTQAQLDWVSQNPGANYVVEWGPWGFAQGNGIGNATGVSIQGHNIAQVTNLSASSNYEFYVREDCDSLTGVNAGPFGFATLAAPLLHPTILIFGDSVQGNVGDTVSVAVRARQFTDMISAQGSVQWDPAVASFLGCAYYGLPNMGANNFGTTQIALGKLTFSWNDPTLMGVSIADSAALFALRMHLSGVPGSACSLGFPDLPTALELVDTSFTSVSDSTLAGQISIHNITVGMLEMGQEWLTIYPNPLWTTTARLRVQVGDGGGEIDGVVLYDFMGRKVAADLAWESKGNEIEMTMDAALRSGCYFLVLETSGGLRYAKLIVAAH